MQPEPNYWLLLGLCIAGAGGLVFVFWLNHKLRTWGQPKSEAPEEETRRAQSPPRTPAPTITDKIMSRIMGSAGEIESAANRLRATPPEGVQRVATPGNGGNDRLPGNPLPEEVRETIRFWAKIEDVEAVIKSGKMGQTEAIELIFACKRTSRPESTYARARAALNTRSEAAYRQRQDRLVEIQEAALVEE